MESELFDNGPLEVGYTVYEDFMNYKSGIYKHITGAQLGGHAVKLIGYGEEEGEKYWICANSWTKNWGEQGFFRIAYGECGIEGQVFGCIPAAVSA
jgi:cathepsin B